MSFVCMQVHVCEGHRPTMATIPWELSTFFLSQGLSVGPRLHQPANPSDLLVSASQDLEFQVLATVSGSYVGARDPTALHPCAAHTLLTGLCPQPSYIIIIIIYHSVREGLTL